MRPERPIARPWTVTRPHPSSERDGVPLHSDVQVPYTPGEHVGTQVRVGPRREQTRLGVGTGTPDTSADPSPQGGESFATQDGRCSVEVSLRVGVSPLVPLTRPPCPCPGRGSGCRHSPSDPGQTPEEDRLPFCAWGAIVSYSPEVPTSDLLGPVRYSGTSRLGNSPPTPSWVSGPSRSGQNRLTDLESVLTPAGPMDHDTDHVSIARRDPEIPQ